MRVLSLGVVVLLTGCEISSGTAGTGSGSSAAGEQATGDQVAAGQSSGNSEAAGAAAPQDNAASPGANAGAGDTPNSTTGGGSTPGATSPAASDDGAAGGGSSAAADQGSAGQGADGSEAVADQGAQLGDGAEPPVAAGGASEDPASADGAAADGASVDPVAEEGTANDDAAATDDASAADEQPADEPVADVPAGGGMFGGGMFGGGGGGGGFGQDPAEKCAEEIAARDDLASAVEQTATGGANVGVPGPDCVPDYCCDPVAPNSGDPYADCVERINQFRACACLGPLERNVDGEACADQHAEYDAGLDSAHAGFSGNICKPGGGAQNECPGWGSVDETVDGCVQMMFYELPPAEANCEGQCYQDHGHFLNMTDTAMKSVSCGFYDSGDGVWQVQNYHR